MCMHLLLIRLTPLYFQNNCFPLGTHGPSISISLHAALLPTQSHPILLLLYHSYTCRNLSLPVRISASSFSATRILLSCLWIIVIVSMPNDIVCRTIVFFDSAIITTFINFWKLYSHLTTHTYCSIVNQHTFILYSHIYIYIYIQYMSLKLNN